LENSNSEIARSNHQALVHRRTAEVNVLSNRLVQTSLLLERAREETRLAQGQLPAKAAALATLEVRQEELQREAAQLPALRRDVATLKEKLQKAQFTESALLETVGRLKAEKADLERKLEDPAFLQVQARRAQEAADVRQRAAANKRIYPTDPRVRLDLQPDGTVRPAITAENAASGGR
jgi:chromosome segregation ATPase